MVSPYLERIRSALEGWGHDDLLPGKDLEALVVFSQYQVNLAEEDGWVYYGQSFKVGVPFCTLVVKGDFDGVPYVVFTSGRTHTRCVSAFLRKQEEDLLEWRKDKFRG